MSEEEKLKFYLEKIEVLAKENLDKENTSALQALKEALNYIESEFIGY